MTIAFRHLRMDLQRLGLPLLAGALLTLIVAPPARTLAGGPGPASAPAAAGASDTVVLRDTFARADTPSGTLGMADTGQQWHLLDGWRALPSSGAQIASHRFVLPQALRTVSADAWLQLPAAPNDLRAEVSFVPGPGSGPTALVLIDSNRPFGLALNEGAPFRDAALHYGLTPTSWSCDLYVGGAGPFSIAKGDFATPLAIDGTRYSFGVHLDLADSTVQLDLPDGTSPVVTDPRIAAGAGPYVAYEIYEPRDSVLGRFDAVSASIPQP